MQNKLFTLLAFTLLISSSTAWAAEDAASRMDRIERRMMALEHQTFSGGGRSGSDSAVASDSADIEARLGSMEEENGKLYGSVEELSKAVQELAKKIDLIVKDIDLRLQDIEKKSTAQ